MCVGRTLRGGGGYSPVLFVCDKEGVTGRCHHALQTGTQRGHIATTYTKRREEVLVYGV